MATAMTGLSRLTAMACTGLLLLAFMAAPRACSGGLDAYAAAGAAVAVMLFLAPFLGRLRPDTAQPLLRAMGGVGLTAVVWIAGLFLADIQIVCRLF